MSLMNKDQLQINRKKKYISNRKMGKGSCQEFIKEDIQMTNKREKCSILQCTECEIRIIIACYIGNQDRLSP